MSQDYRFFAVRHLLAALEKEEDAPASAAMHEEEAKYALRVMRVPETGEVLRYIEISQGASIAEDWPCSFGHHEHKTREEAVTCARTRR